MKKITLSILTIGLLFISSIQANAQSKKAKPKKSTVTAKPVATKKEEVKAATAPMPSPEEMQKAWMDYATPKEMHRFMAESDGEWEGTVMQWMAPGAEPMKSECKSVNKMIMDGRYQISEVSGTMMGMPFEGRSILAYDNAKNVFVSTWIDNMGTGLMTMTGKWNKETRSIEFVGKMTDPVSKGDMDFRETMIFKDEKTQIMQMHAPAPDGSGEFMTMEIIFRRKFK